MHDRHRQRQDAVMSAIRREAAAQQAARQNTPKPGETVEQMRERQHRGYVFMRDLMRRTREREDGTWYLGLDDETGSDPKG